MSYWESLFTGILNGAGHLVPATEKADAPVIKAGSVSLNVGEVRTALTALKTFNLDDLGRAVEKRFANVNDDEAVLNETLKFLATVGVPDAAPILALVKFSEVLIPILVANEFAHPINNLVVDAQTSASSETHGRWIGR